MTNEQQLISLKRRLKECRDRQLLLAREVTRSKWTPLQWMNERKLNQNLNEIEMLQHQISNLERYGH
jgi:hypothetical protein